MAVLLEIFDEERPRLSEQIREEPDPTKVARRVRNFLGSLPTKYEEKRNDLTLNEKRRLGFLTDVLKDASSLLIVHTAELYRPDVRTGHTNTQWDKLKKAAQMILFVLLLGVLLTAGGFLALLLLFLLVAVTLPASVLRSPDKWLPYFLSQIPETNQEDAQSGEANNVQVVVQVNVSELLTQLRQMIKTVETAFEDEADEPEPLPANPIHEAKDLLDFFQNLLEAAQFKDAEFALRTVRSLKRLLLDQHIQIEDYEEGQNDRHFSFLPGGDARRQTQKLALVSAEGRLLVRGIVLEASENT